MNRTRRNERMNARQFGLLDGIPGGINVLFVGPGQSANDGDVAINLVIAFSATNSKDIVRRGDWI